MGDPMFNPVFRSTPAGIQGAKGQQRAFGAAGNNNGLFAMGSTNGSDVVSLNTSLAAQSAASTAAKPKTDDTKSIISRISTLSGKDAAKMLNSSLAAQLQNPPEEGFVLD